MWPKFGASSGTTCKVVFGKSSHSELTHYPRNRDESTYAFASRSTKARNLASISVAEVVG
jgi:hypothetical protein